MGGFNRRDVLRKSIIASAGGVLAVSNTASASESTVCVNPSNPDCFDKIQRGINEVAPGGTVEVAPGVYPEEVFVDKSVTLRGDPGGNSPHPGEDAPILDGEGESKNAVVITPDTEGVTITGFEIRNYERERGTSSGRAILGPRRTKQITITDNYIHNLGFGGIISSFGSTHSDWRVERNTVSDIARVGIRLSNASHSIIRQNVIEGTGGHENKNIGSEFTISGVAATAKRKNGNGPLVVEDIVIENNEITGQYSGFGIGLFSWNANKGDEKVILRNVTARENNVNGVTKSPAFGSVNLLTFDGAVLEDIALTSNDLSENRIPVQINHVRGEQGIHRNLECTDNVVNGEHIGVRISDISDASITLRGNEIHENDYGILVVNEGGQYVTARGNNITGNETAGLQNQTDTEVDAKENWWGAENGPERRAGRSGNTVGDGDRVRGNVDYRPWSSQEL